MIFSEQTETGLKYFFLHKKFVRGTQSEAVKPHMVLIPKSYIYPVDMSNVSWYFSHIYTTAWNLSYQWNSKKGFFILSYIHVSTVFYIHLLACQIYIFQIWNHTYIRHGYFQRVNRKKTGSAGKSVTSRYWGTGLHRAWDSASGADQSMR